MTLKIESLPIDKLKLDPSNARKHSEANLSAIAESLKQFGQRKPIVITADNVIVAGNGTVEAARLLGLTDVDVVRVPEDWSADQVKAFALADNRTAELAEWNPEVLSAQLLELDEAGFDLQALGFDIATEEAEHVIEVFEDKIPESVLTRVAPGDVWILGDHRLMCGDSTKPADVERLVGKEKAQLLHADPPYGMGKENDGVANDNLYKDKLDAFQLSWWNTFKPFLDENASAYIWGTAPDLWRLWHFGGLGDSEPLTFRNEIVWAKRQAQGQGSSKHRMYPTASERMLFFMRGVQGFNTNAENYWDGWEPIRSYLATECETLGWKKADVSRITGTASMAQHWISTSQWTFILEHQYEALKREANGKAFKREYEELKREYEELKREYYEGRAYFDNTHENMTDVWQFDGVSGEERYGHATPKPVLMMTRVMKSSLPKKGLCLEPFAGSGATLIAAEQTDRRCFTMELNPEYCDIVLTRWETLTGKKAVLQNASR